ncbi:hypothetical protein NHJ13051_002189 [Beauveria bassiana]
MRQDFGDATWAKIREGAAIWDEIIHLLQAAEPGDPGPSG